MEIDHMSSIRFFHGSMNYLPTGTILRPRGEAYEADWGDADFYHVLEYYRPVGCLPHKDAIFLVDDPEDIDLAGGGTEYCFEVVPQGEISSHDLNWSSEISVLVDQGYDLNSLEVKNAALSYWKGTPHTNESVWEYLVKEAEIVRVEPFESFEVLPSKQQGEFLMSASSIDVSMQEQGFSPSKVFVEGVEADAYVKLFSGLSDERVVVVKSGHSDPPENIQDKVDVYIDNSRDIIFFSENEFQLSDFLQAEKLIDYESFVRELHENIQDMDNTNYVVKTESGRGVGLWDGQNVHDLKNTLAYISENMLNEHEQIKMDELPRSDLIPEELAPYTGYPIWAMDKEGNALIGEDVDIVDKQTLGHIFKEYNMTETKSLYQKLRETGVEMDNHESDLYVRDTQEVRDIIKQHRAENDGYPQAISRFTEQETKQTWIDIPFAYDPYWEARAEKDHQEDLEDDDGPAPGR